MSALVAKDGSIDWMCAPRFDSDAVFAKLLGEDEHGFWSIRPAGPFSVQRRYIPDTMVVETRFTCGQAEVRLEDALIIGNRCHGIGFARVGDQPGLPVLAGLQQVDDFQSRPDQTGWLDIFRQHGR